MCLEGQGIEYGFDKANSEILSLRNQDQPFGDTDKALKVKSLPSIKNNNHKSHREAIYHILLVQIY